MQLRIRLLVLLFTSSLVTSLLGQDPNSPWQYMEIDASKPKWGDYAAPNWLRYFGLDMGDVNGDGQLDIVSGRSVYLSPGGDMASSWQRVDLGLNVDGILLMDVDGDGQGDILGQALPDLYWLKPSNPQATAWEAIKVGEVPATTHVNSQGFTRGQVVAGGREDILIAGNGNIYLFEVPKNPRNQWKRTLVAENTSDEGIGLGDIDGDGDLDIAAGRRPDGGDEPLIIVWYENPGNSSGSWTNYEIGKTNHPADRIGVADLNGDAKADIIVCEERYPGKEPDGNIFWYEQGADRTGQWQRHHVTTQYSINNLDLKDMDGDGDIDIITCEHKGPNLQLQIWKNDGAGSFEKEVIDTGKESHLGTQVEDMDGDGDWDIVSIGWDQYQYVHLWRNDQ